MSVRKIKKPIPIHCEFSVELYNGLLYKRSACNKSSRDLILIGDRSETTCEKCLEAIQQLLKTGGN